MSSLTVYLVTGANRGSAPYSQSSARIATDRIPTLGLGFELVKTYLARSNTTVIATVRDPADPSSSKLSSLPKSSSSNLIVVKLDSASTNDPATVVQKLQDEHNITYLDVVIANAGISLPQAFGPAASVKASDLKEHFNVNTIGPLLLFQATLPLLKEAAHGSGKYVGVSSPIGSIGGMEQRPYPMTAYGVSKAALNWLVRKIHFENEDIISFALDPGYVFHFPFPSHHYFLGELGAHNSGTASSKPTSATPELSTLA